MSLSVQSVTTTVDEAEDTGEVIGSVDHVPVWWRSSVTSAQSQSPQPIVEASVMPMRRVGRPRKARQILPNQPAIHRYFRRQNDVNDNDGSEDEELTVEVDVPATTTGTGASAVSKPDLTFAGVVEANSTVLAGNGL